MVIGKVVVVNLEIILFLRWEMLTTAFTIPTILWVLAVWGQMFLLQVASHWKAFRKPVRQSIFLVLVPGVVITARPVVTDLIWHWSLARKEDAVTDFSVYYSVGKEDMIDPVMEKLLQVVDNCSCLQGFFCFLGLWFWFWFGNSLTTRKALHCKDKDKDKFNLLSIIGGLLEWSYLRHLQKKLLGLLPVAGKIQLSFSFSTAWSLTRKPSSVLVVK